MDSIKKITVIIRSVGERTQQLCEELTLKQGVPKENLFVINEKPFSKAMKVGYQIGVERGLKWTYCIDADVLMKEGAIKEMVQVISKKPENTLGISGKLLDKLLGKKRTAGNHLFRTKHLPRIISNIKPYKDENIRPESTIINELKGEGYFFYKNVGFIGLHDFEQHYHDIARKAYTHSIKHNEFLSEFITHWRIASKKDPDFDAAIFGLSKGLLHLNSIKINIDDFEALYEQVKTQLGTKKDEISSFRIKNFEDVFEEMHNTQNYFQLNDRLNDRYKKIFQQQFNSMSYLKILKSIALKLRKDFMFK